MLLAKLFSQLSEVYDGGDVDAICCEHAVFAVVDHAARSWHHPTALILTSFECVVFVRAPQLSVAQSGDERDERDQQRGLEKPKAPGHVEFSPASEGVYLARLKSAPFM